MHNPETAQDEIIDDFSLFPDWLDRYQYLIDLGKKLPALSADEMVDDNLVEGCQSRVWFVTEGNRDNMTIRANSDAAIVSGLIALLIRVYSGASAEDIVNTEPRFVQELGLASHLSPTRSTGLHAMLQSIKASALREIAGA